MVLAAVALGSNLGDRLGHLRRAVAGLGRLGTLRAVSSLYETAPVGGPAQGPFLNAAVTLETGLGPGELLTGLQRLEEEAGRTRGERWGPRTLDLDLITYGEQSIDQPDLQVPHPRAGGRGFVLQPLVEILPHAKLREGTAAALLGAVRGQRAIRLATDWSGEGLRYARSGMPWVYGQAVLVAGWAVTLVATGAIDAGIVARMIGLSLAILGAALAGAGLRWLGPAMTVNPRPRIHAPLATEGPYSLVRHPIYGGVVLGALGLAVAFESWAAVLVALALGALFLLKSREEETFLRLVHPDYSDYAAKVNKRLLPWVV